MATGAGWSSSGRTLGTGQTPRTAAVRNYPTTGSLRVLCVTTAEAWRERSARCRHGASGWVSAPSADPSICMSPWPGLCNQIRAVSPHTLTQIRRSAWASSRRWAACGWVPATALTRTERRPGAFSREEIRVCPGCVSDKASPDSAATARTARHRVPLSRAGHLE